MVRIVSKCCVSVRRIFFDEQAKRFYIPYTLIGKRASEMQNQTNVLPMNFDSYDLFWTLPASDLTEKQIKVIAIKFAVFCAKRALPLFEVNRPKDDRPRKAIGVAELWLCRNAQGFVAKLRNLRCKGHRDDPYLAADAAAEAIEAPAGKAAAQSAGWAGDAAQSAVSGKVSTVIWSSIWAAEYADDAAALVFDEGAMRTRIRRDNKRVCVEYLSKLIQEV